PRPRAGCPGARAVGRAAPSSFRVEPLAGRTVPEARNPHLAEQCPRGGEVRNRDLAPPGPRVELPQPESAVGKGGTHLERCPERQRLLVEACGRVEAGGAPPPRPPPP